MAGSNVEGIASPFDGLAISCDLACEFFAVFSRFEFALKECGFVYVNREGRAVPDWRGYRDRAATLLRIQDDAVLVEAVAYLNDEPPQVQVGAQSWSDTSALRGTAPAGTALDATQRVRNNLFHGGKHSPHSPPGRDEKLVRAGLAVLYACLTQDDNLRREYEQPTVY